jgi:hypothetical protein
VIRESPGSGPSSGTISAQSAVCGKFIRIGLSTIGFKPSLPSADGVACTRNTGILFLRNACASFAAFATTVFAGYGSVGIPTIPLYKSINEKFAISIFIIVFRLSKNSFSTLTLKVN